MERRDTPSRQRSACENDGRMIGELERGRLGSLTLSPGSTKWAVDSFR